MLLESVKESIGVGDSNIISFLLSDSPLEVEITPYRVIWRDCRSPWEVEIERGNVE